VVVLKITRNVQGNGQRTHGSTDCTAKTKTPATPPKKQDDNNSLKYQHCTARSSTSYELGFLQDIVSAATNTSLFDGVDVTSDIHAEIDALALVCRSSQSTESCTACIPIHPCKRCFAALVTFGIRRKVCRRESPPSFVRLLPHQH
jgi:deoxycytidylate deaminase